MRFGFSYLGLLFLLMLTVPNLLWVRHKPKSYDRYVQNENCILLLLERVGEVSVTCIVLFFCDFRGKTLSNNRILLAAAFFLMILYELYWVRYFRSGKTMRDFYSSLLGIPVAGALLPVAAFLLLGISGRNIPLIAAVILLGIGHIGIHLAHRAELQKEKFLSR